jgi:hypothetical protein
MADTTLRFQQPAKPLSNFEKAIQASAGNPATFRSEFDALNAGFSSAADMTTNRIMRNQLEAKATAANMPLAEAYKLAGPDLTNTASLQQAWNQIPAQPSAPAQQQAAPKSTASTATPTEKSQQYTSDADKILAGIEALLAGLPDYGAEMKQMREDFAQSQRTLAANMSMSQKTPNLQIQPASGTPQTGGTQSFRRRPRQFGGGAAGTVLAGLNLGQPSMMNV